MTRLLALARLMFAASPAAFLRGAALGCLVLAMGALLLGLSGWFVTASAAAGIAGVGIGFDFFRPSAGVRLLAMGRAGARYGERMLTHDATLRALAALRGRLYLGITHLPFEAQSRLRGAAALNRLTADVDALDGLLLRLVLPTLSSVAVLCAAFGLLWWLVTPGVAVAVTVIHALGGGFALRRGAARARAPSEAEETALQSARAAMLDLAQGRADLAVSGALGPALARITEGISACARARSALDQADRHSGTVLTLTTASAAAAALALGGVAAQSGQVDGARAAIGFFAALALGEGLATLRRGLAEIGRMQTAGARVLALIDTPPRACSETLPQPAPPLLAARGLVYHRPGAARAAFGPLDLDLAPGETVLLTGASGAGKSTLLAALAGVIAPSGGTIMLAGAPLAHWPEPALRARLTLVPQRSALIGGTIAENLGLATEGPLDPARAWLALDAVALGPVLRARDGLATCLGPGGTGLSGGESRRLCLARAALRDPDILLLDEPTEGLDAATAAAVLEGLRALLPATAFLIVSHHRDDLALAGRHITLSRTGINSACDDPSV